MIGRTGRVGVSRAEDLNALDLEQLGQVLPEVRPVEKDQFTLDFIIDLTSDQAVPHRLQSAPRWQLTVKRVFDVVGASVILILISPLMMLTVLAIAITSPGPVFFAQERVGYMGQTFRLLKFRSMCHDAEARKEEILHYNHHNGPIFKIKNDPRITPIGRLIRRLSIDELPQLFHVLWGTMSLVGPRPPLPEEVATYDARQLHRLSVKPGITCIWQVSGRSDIDFDTWVAMDIEYIENWNLWLDLRLLARTIPAVLSRRGAY